MHKYEALEHNPLTSTQVENALASQSLTSQPISAGIENKEKNDKDMVTDEIGEETRRERKDDEEEDSDDEDVNGSKEVMFDFSKPPKNISEMIGRLTLQLETRMDHLEQLFDR